MGSFYSTCSVSNMTLANQKTSILLLSPGYSTEIGTTNMIVSNSGSQAFYSPFGFPIHGEYDDYGYIDNIQRDKNVEMLEDFFGISIDDIIRNIGDDRNIPENIKNKEIFENLSMTYFRTEVLEYLQLGWDEINIINPDKWTMDDKISKLLKTLSKEKISYDHPRLSELISKKDRTDSEKEELFDLMDLLNGSAIRENSYIELLAKFNMFKLLPITLDFQDDILKQYMFLNNLGFSLNKILLPSVYGSQDTNWLELYKFNNFVNELLIKDLKEYYCDEEYDELNSIITSHERDKKINEILN